jgi:lanosterol synthase
MLLDTLFQLMSTYERFILPCVPFLRNKGLQKAYELIIMDDENTSYQDLAPVNKVLNFVCRFVEEGQDSEAMRLHRAKLRDFLWMSNEGMMACGTNGSRRCCQPPILRPDRAMQSFGTVLLSLKRWSRVV